MNYVSLLMSVVCAVLIPAAYGMEKTGLTVEQRLGLNQQWVRLQFWMRKPVFRDNQEWIKRKEEIIGTGTVPANLESWLDHHIKTNQEVCRRDINLEQYHLEEEGFGSRQ